jgi:hypothetical protein
VTADEIRRAAGVLFEPGQVVEVRAFPESDRPRSGYFDDLDVLAEKVDALAANPTITGIYWTVNPANPNLLARRHNGIGPAKETTTDAGIVRRRWLLVDADPTRPSGISATDGEKAAAFARAEAIAGALETDGWPAPVLADSGNGAHLLYRVDLPNDADATALVRRCLEALAARFSDEAVKVDVSVSNAARIVRVYGTPNRKGANMPDRPHRSTALAKVPDVLEPVPVELLHALADEVAPATATATATPTGTTTATAKTVDGIDLRAWIEKRAGRLTEIGIAVRETPKAGHRFFATLEPCPWSKEHTDGAFIGQLDHGGIYARCHHDSCGGAGGPNRWRELREIIEPSKEPKPKPKKDRKGDEDEDEAPKRTLSFFEEDDRLYVVAMTEHDAFGFLHLDDAGTVHFDARITLADGTVIEPRRLGIHQDSGELMRVVGIPRADLVRTAPLLEAGVLFDEMNRHINEYVDMPDIEREIGIYYALFTWFYPKRSTSPYLRYIGDTGTGKTRTARAVADLCFLPILLSGGTSPSALMRMHEKWRGTTFIEEADLKGDAADPVIKWLNAGFEKGAWIMLSDKNDPNNQQSFSPWGPKVIAMRVHFKDNATESRCLSYSPQETTRPDIPAELPAKYYHTVERLRAKIARFVLAHWQKFDPEWVVTVDGIEPRTRQLSEPISSVLQYFPDGEDRYRVYVKARQQELKRTRAESKEGSFFNEALSRAQGEGDDGPADVVTPRMVADAFKTTPTAVTNALKSIGFVIERERIEVVMKRDERGAPLESRKKQVRKLVVPSSSKWLEITNRYFFDPDGKPAPECPDALRGSGWPLKDGAAPEPFKVWDRAGDCVPETSRPSQESHASDHPDGPVTSVTLVTLTEHAGPPPSDQEKYVHIQANPNPCGKCGAAPSHYTASASGALMVDIADTTNHYLCKRCWLDLAATGNPVVVEVDANTVESAMPADEADEVAA